ncbi:hypothetical protein D8676_12695 [Mesorhizobium sp. YM1C-6-2]|nr:hypothetical protein D8676_12695 [Mesorhizobium sp. YM1C-6-2]
MAKLYMVTVRWVKTPANPKLIDEALTPIALDWIRFHAWTWLLWTEKSPDQITNTIRLRLKPEDHLLVMPIAPDAYEGWALPWVWDWIRPKMEELKRH